MEENSNNKPKRRRIINEVAEIKTEPINMITPDNSNTNLPYQGFMTQQQFYLQSQQSCFELDSTINDLVKSRLSGRALRHMSDEDVINTFKALEKAKNDRTKAFLDLATKMSQDEFFRRQQELEKVKLYSQGNIVDSEPIEVVAENDEDDIYNKEKREKEQQIERLIQEAIMEKIERGDSE